MQKLKINSLLSTDSYKITHHFQYPPDTRHVYSYLESRGGFWKHVLFFGLQYTLKAYFVGTVFTKADIDEARLICAQHFGTDEAFNYTGWTRLLEKHGGKLPLKIRAVPEGTLVPVHNALMTIENTDEEFPWLTNWAETVLLRGTWYPTTVCTLSWEIKQAIGKDLVRTGDPSLLPFKAHDFGARGVSSQESAAIGGAAHLVNFMGTDTMESIFLLRDYYAASMPGFSIAAMEHSTVTSWGEDNEARAYANMLDKSPTLLTACVVDSYDTHHAVADIFGGELREKILRRAGTVVLRPDSGDPVVVIEDIFNSIADKFGFETNAKGWKVLPQQIRVIQGDGVNYQNILRINSALTRAGWSMDNWGYGIGGSLLQQLNRDTMRFAIKCSAIDRGGVWYNVNKNPKTDLTKASRGGRFCLLPKDHGDYVTVEQTNDMPIFGNVLDTVFEDGVLKREHTLIDIRERAASYDRYLNAV
jgi:nicotinamide phosphoribosyltransferase